MTATLSVSIFGVDGKKLQRQCKKHHSNFSTWNQGDHANKWLLFPQNIGQHLSIDEVNLSMRELYTVVTNKAAKGKKGAIVASLQEQNLISSLTIYKK